ncbi:MAG: hypothetical protein GY832_22700 [Chloroflexi bacterium]|nr:hypothetical protein [Chloroflexota bacterium]
MNQETTPRLWIAFGIGIVAVLGLALLLVFLGREPSTLTPMVAPTSPVELDENPVVASVNGQPIRYSVWFKSVLLDQVLSGLAEQPIPTSDETLQRLVNEELVVNAFPSEQAATTEQIEERIAMMEDAWGVNDETVVTALKDAGLIRADLVRAIGRLLVVQESLEALQSQGYEPETWLEEQRANAEIVIEPAFEGAEVPMAVAQSPLQSPLAQPDTSPVSTPTPVLATATSVTVPTPSPLPSADQAQPESAPDFTLDRAGGDTFTLSDQLAQGPVVLIFFQKCG